MASATAGSPSDKLQQQLDQYNKDFYDMIQFFPEAYGRHSVDKTSQE